MANQFFVAPSPHVHSAESTTKIMRDVVIALLPALVVSALLFGWSVLGVTALSVVCCVVFEYLIQRFMLRGAPTVGNLSAVVTGVLLAFNLPASIPWWIVVIGAFVAIAIGKMTFGGLGKNPFNPALVGRVFLLIAYPAQMTSFPQPAGAVADAFSGATPLAAVKFGAVSASAIDYQDMLFGSIPGSLGEVAALALLAGYLLVGAALPVWSAKRGQAVAREYRQALADTNSYVLESLRGLRDTLQYQDTAARAAALFQTSVETAEKEAVGDESDL